MTKAVQNYLKHLLQSSALYTLTELDQKQFEKIGVESFIFAKLSSKKFRKTKMDEHCIDRTQKAIHTKVKANQPISVVFPQGGYKLWRFPSSPTVDFAEFFNISYVLSYIAPIAAVYKPGVHLTYYMHTLLMELHDNLTIEEIQAYVDSFEQLLDEFRKHLPPNVKISILRDADLYTRKEYFEALEAGTQKAKEAYVQFTPEKKEYFARMSRLNIKWDGKENWTKLSDKEKDEKIYLAAIYEMSAVNELKKVAQTVKSSDNILVFTKGTPDFIGIGSTRASSAKYWVGFGVLVQKGDSLLPIVLTPSQYESVTKKPYQTVEVNVLPGANFKQILFFDQPFSFS